MAVGWLLALGAVAFLYAAVGHAGASGYIALLTLAGLSASTIKPLALILNTAVAALTCWQFRRAGHLRWRPFWLLLPLALPAAFCGGWMQLPGVWFARLVALVLLASALRFLVEPREPATLLQPRPWQLLAAGGGLGLLAGLTGTGGGVFLSPLLLLRRWATAHQSAAIASLFILVNSIAGLAGLAQAQGAAAFARLPPLGPLLLVVALSGGLGARLGSRHWSGVLLRRLLSLVVLMAALKLLGAGMAA